MSLTLTVRQIADLAEFAGLMVQQPEAEDCETEITVRECPPEGITNDGEPNDPNTVSHYAHIAWCTDYPEDGCVGLGPEIDSPPEPTHDR
jgi:hypothetical protein